MRTESSDSLDPNEFVRGGPVSVDYEFDGNLLCGDFCFIRGFYLVDGICGGAYSGGQKSGCVTRYVR